VGEVGEAILEPRGVAGGIVINLTNIWKIYKKKTRNREQVPRLNDARKNRNMQLARCSYRNSFGFLGSLAFRLNQFRLRKSCTAIISY